MGWALYNDGGGCVAFLPVRWMNLDAQSKTNLLYGKWPALGVVAAPSPPGDGVVETSVGNWIPTMSDVVLGFVSVFLAVGHFLGWFLLSPYPVAFAAVVGALGAPFLVWLRISDAWHRRKLSKMLADDAEKSANHRGSA